uniref:Small ribosomal subunit protein mS29 n=1 Tax=Strongyloides venezuelensis TaxID=75913 RepID=A0A0K0F5W4_STRVS
MLKRTIQGARQNVTFFRCIMASTNDPSQLKESDIGKLYTVSGDVATKLHFDKVLPSKYIRQLDTFSECSWLIREPFFEILNKLSTVNKESLPLRFVLFGRFGTGKSITLYQLVHYAYTQKWVILNIKSVMDITRQLTETQSSTKIEGKLDTQKHAIKALELFKTQNQDIWDKLSELKTTKEYLWTKIDKTNAGKPITDIVEIGLLGAVSSTECFGAFIEELKHYSTSGEIKLLVAIDDANSLYGKTNYKKIDGSYASTDDLSMVYYIKKLLDKDWRNGAIVMIADEKEVKDARDTLTIPLVTPLELFGEKGYEDIVPFTGIQTRNYSEKEINVIYDYYKSKNWLVTPEAGTKDGKNQLIYLSAFNPHHFERLCAFV